MVDAPNNDASKRWHIMQVVCKEFGFTIQELKRGGKTRPLFHARAVFAYILRIHLADTLQRIADELEVDHSTVLNQIKVCEDLIFKNHGVKTSIKKIEQELLNKQLI